MWKFTVQAMWKTHLNFKGCRGSALRGLSGQGMWKKQKICSGPPFWRLLSDLHTVVQPGTDTVHLHGFLLWPICTTLYSIFDACWKLFSCDWLKWVNVNVQYTYCCASLLYPSMVGTWRSRFKLNIGWKPQKKKIKKKKCCFQKKTQNRKQLFLWDLQYFL